MPGRDDFESSDEFETLVNQHMNEIGTEPPERNKVLEADPEYADRNPEADARKAYHEIKARDEAREHVKSTYGRFAERATKEGTSIHDALTHYVAIEDQLKADPVAGIAIIAQNVGMSPQQVRVAMQQLEGQPFGGTAAQSNMARLAAAETAINQMVSHPAFAALEPYVLQAFNEGKVARTGNHAFDLAKAAQWAEKQMARDKEAAMVARKKADSRGVSSAPERTSSTPEWSKQAAQNGVGSKPGEVRDRRYDRHGDVQADALKAYRQHSQQ